MGVKEDGGQAVRHRAEGIEHSAVRLVVRCPLGKGGRAAQGIEQRAKRRLG
jgi:hypothetical protein